MLSFLSILWSEKIVGQIKNSSFLSIIWPLSEPNAYFFQKNLFILFKK